MKIKSVLFEWTFAYKSLKHMSKLLNDKRTKNLFKNTHTKILTNKCQNTYLLRRIVVGVILLPSSIKLTGINVKIKVFDDYCYKNITEVYFLQEYE